MKSKQTNSISFSDYDNMGSRIKLLPILLVVLLIAALGAGGYFGYKFINALNNRVVSIEVTKMPNKTLYFIGDEANYDGLEVTATRKNGKAFVLDADEFEITGFSSEYASEQSVLRARYGDISAIFIVEVREQPVELALVQSISFKTLPKTQYKLGEWLNTDDGVIKIEYSNKIPVYLNLTNDMVYGFSQVTAPGTYTLTVKYKENGIIATTTYTITVTE